MGNIKDDVTIPSQSPPQISVIIVPFPAQGHLNQMLQLSCLISSYAIPVHYVSSATHNRQSLARARGLNPVSISKIQFHDLPIPHFPSPPPDPHSANRFPAQLQPAFDASLSLRGPLADLMARMSETHRRVVVIHDALIASVVQDINSLPNGESYAFNCLSAYCEVKFVYELMGKECPVPRLRDLPLISTCISDRLQIFIGVQRQALEYRAGDLYNTCRPMEGPFLDILRSDEVARGRRSWAVGPLLASKAVSGDLSGGEARHECLEWLDGQEAGSVMYVSFGTTCSLTDDEIRELALGLELSGHKFLWVLRDADKANVFDCKIRTAQLPKGFEERMKSRGLVVRDWAPQTQILSHGSTGGFMSHCGWNSCIESLTVGVPIAAWPMHSDQPTNAVLVTEILRVGFPVRKWAHTPEAVKASTIETVVKRLMGSEEVKKRAQDMAATIRKAMEEGGTSRAELDSFIAHINREEESA